MIPKTNPPLPLLASTALFALLFIRLAYIRFVHTEEMLPGGLESLFLMVTIGLTIACFIAWKNR